MLHDVVPAARIGNAERRQIAEEVLTDAEARGVADVVALLAADVGEAHHRLARQIVDAAAVFLARLLVRTRRRDDIDRRAADHVDVVVTPHRHFVVEAFANEHRRPLHFETAAVVAVIHHVRAVLRQDRGIRDARQQRQAALQTAGT